METSSGHQHHGQQPPQSPAILACAWGSGILCGLEIWTDEHCSVSIAEGHGLTSTGQLIHLPELLHFTRRRRLRVEDAADAAIIAYFHDIHRIWELLPKPNDGETELPHTRSLTPQNPKDIEAARFLFDKVAAVYLPENGDTPRVFLLNRQDVLQKIVLPGQKTPPDKIEVESNEDDDFSIWQTRQKQGDESIPDHDIYNSLHPGRLLNDLRMRRFGYGALLLDDLPCDERYKPAICGLDADKCKEGKELFICSFADLVQEYVRIVDDAFERLLEQTDLFIKKSGVRHDLQLFDETLLQRHLKAVYNRWLKFKKRPVAEQIAIQYWWSFASDLLITFNEWRDAYNGLKSDCECNPDEHPLHLFLGTFTEEVVMLYPNPFRHRFRRFHALVSGGEPFEQMRFYYWRLVLMLKSFFVPGLELDDTSFDDYDEPLSDPNLDNPTEDLSQPALSDRLPIRITPSLGFEFPLGKRAIPFYYDLSESDYSLHHVWDYLMTKLNKADHHFSYHSDTVPDGYTNLEMVIHPFAFDIREYPFYRIEGHTGREAHEVVNRLMELKQQYNICFEIRGIVLDCAISRMPFCEKCLDHMGGVYAGGCFYLIAEKRPVKRKHHLSECYSTYETTMENWKARWHKEEFELIIVADFAVRPGCGCQCRQEKAVPHHVQGDESVPHVRPTEVAVATTEKPKPAPKPPVKPKPGKPK